jgi:hypothetical protein
MKLSFKNPAQKFPSFPRSIARSRSYIPIAMYAPVVRPFQTLEYQHNPNNPPWQKLLWVKQNYPDNYVDSTFLDELQRNGEHLFFITKRGGRFVHDPLTLS